MTRPPPVDIESQSRRLRDVLEGPVSDRWAVVQAAAFLEQLAATRPVGEAYLLPLAEPLADRAEALDPIGLPPGILMRLAETLRAAQTAHAAVGTSSAVQRAETALRRRAGLLFGYAGATERALACVASSVEPGELGDLAGGTPRERLGAASSTLAGSEGATAVRWLQEHWERGGEDSSSAVVPVVERLPSWARTRSASGAETENSRTQVGALRRLSIELYGSADSMDRLRTDASASGREDLDLTDAPVAAARRLLEQRFSGVEERYVHGRLVLGTPQHAHEGQSAGLAVAALFYGAVLRHTRQRRRLQVRSEAGLTGNVDPDGTVLPVAEEGLQVKVRTAFFSPTTRLVVPTAQQQEAEAVRDDLLGEFPNGRLDVIGVDQLEDLFFDRRLTHLKCIGWARHTAQRLWDRRGRVVAGTLIAGLLLVIAALLYGPLDKNPVTVAFAGTEMVLKNESGRVLDRISVGEKTAQMGQEGAFNAYRLGDIDRNGQNEVCWSGRDENQLDERRWIQCKGAGEDSVRWALETRFDVPFSRKPAIATETFQAEHLRIGDFDANGRPEVIATLRHNKYFPYLVLKLDAATGRVQGKYMHPGFFFAAPRVADLNGNDVQEILLAGMNNAFDQAVFTVLDPRFINGHGPTRGDYVVEGRTPARELIYLRIPPTIVDRAQPQAVNKAVNIHLYEETEDILVEVQDGKHPSEEERASQVLVRLNRQFEPVSIGTSSPYDRLSEWLAERGRIDDVPDYEYFQRYKKQFQYWTGSGWTSEPTLNVRWTAVADSDTIRTAASVSTP